MVPPDSWRSLADEAGAAVEAAAAAAAALEVAAASRRRRFELGKVGPKEGGSSILKNEVVVSINS